MNVPSIIPELDRRIAELERQLATEKLERGKANERNALEVAVRQKAEEDRDFWEGRSKLMQSQRDTRFAEASEARTQANMRAVELADERFKLAAARKERDKLKEQLCAVYTRKNLAEMERDELAAALEQLRNKALLIRLNEYRDGDAVSRDLVATIDAALAAHRPCQTCQDRQVTTRVPCPDCAGGKGDA